MTTRCPSSSSRCAASPRRVPPAACGERLGLRPYVQHGRRQQRPTAAVGGADSAADASPSSSSSSSSRRQLFASAAAAAAVVAALGPTAAAALAASPPEGQGGASFYSQWPYIEPSDILPYLEAAATPGDPGSVLDAIDRFAEYYPMYRWV